MVRVYGVVLDNEKKKEYFTAKDVYSLNDLVVFETDRGEQLGKVSQILEKENVENTKNLLRKATDEDYAKYLENLKDAYIALRQSRKIAKDLGLEMNIVSASFNLTRSQLLFNFTADNRIDFRELAKKIAGQYHTRIELRQIGARDKAKICGGIGVCGRELCCGGFLKEINTISMNMAKNQNLALNPAKINGSCGRLLCCLSYEDDNYIESSKGLPMVGDVIKTEKGEATVIGVDILSRKVKLLSDGEKWECTYDEARKE